MKILLVATLCLALPIFLPEPATTAGGGPSSFTVEAPISRAGPRLTVRVTEQQERSNWHYDLHVTTTDGVDQHIPFRNGRPVTKKDIRLVDLNADGFLDIMVAGGKDHRGADWFKTWIYDAKAKKFRWINDR